MQYQETAKDLLELKEKFGNDLSIFNSLIVTSEDQIQNNLKIKYIIYLESADFYIVVYDKFLKEALLERQIKNWNVQ